MGMAVKPHNRKPTTGTTVVVSTPETTSTTVHEPSLPIDNTPDAAPEPAAVPAPWYAVVGRIVRSARYIVTFGAVDTWSAVTATVDAVHIGIACAIRDVADAIAANPDAFTSDTVRGRVDRIAIALRTAYIARFGDGPSAPMFGRSTTNNPAVLNVECGQNALYVACAMAGVRPVNTDACPFGIAVWVAFVRPSTCDFHAHRSYWDSTRGGYINGKHGPSMFPGAPDVVRYAFNRNVDRPVTVTAIDPVTKPTTPEPTA